MIYQFKMQLKDVEHPQVWQRITVPKQYDFLSFHKIIQALFGLNNRYKFRFSPTGNNSGTVVSKDGSIDDIDAWKADSALLCDVFTHPQQEYIYTCTPCPEWTPVIELEAETESIKQIIAYK